MHGQGGCQDKDAQRGAQRREGLAHHQDERAAIGHLFPRQGAQAERRERPDQEGDAQCAHRLEDGRHHERRLGVDDNHQAGAGRKAKPPE